MLRKRLEKMLGKDDGDKIAYISLNQIISNSLQPRHQFNEQGLVDLARSIGLYGLIEPIIVRPYDNKYQIVTGERRFRACYLLGKSQIAAIIREMDDEEALTVSLTENLQHQELNYIEEAETYNVLINGFGLTREELARKTGRSQSAIADKLRLFKLPEYIRRMINPTIVSEKHAQALLKINSSNMQEEVINQIYEKELTVKDTEELVESLSRNNIPAEIKPRNNSQNVSMIIRDTRIFMNTIKETVKRARQTGVDILMIENDDDNKHEIIIQINKEEQKTQALA
ncbi:MAG TPA: nucleoid occlusion protein [Syntrophomonas sp.]|jgi:ParB family chromosome partitioning protein|nr:nucleoid occlusion protein [Syntrophomonas sp.]